MSWFFDRKDNDLTILNFNADNENMNNGLGNSVGRGNSRLIGTSGRSRGSRHDFHANSSRNQHPDGIDDRLLTPPQRFIPYQYNRTVSQGNNLSRERGSRNSASMVPGMLSTTSYYSSIIRLYLHYLLNPEVGSAEHSLRNAALVDSLNFNADNENMNNGLGNSVGRGNSRPRGTSGRSRGSRHYFHANSSRNQHPDGIDDRLLPPPQRSIQYQYNRTVNQGNNLSRERGSRNSTPSGSRGGRNRRNRRNRYPDPTRMEQCVIC
ncbi:synaptic functional regulator FMR1 isoform X2 [Aphis craccivora]|uniref:Synaptic functional regulator FMR1 isoform X2 n=1 Tax=Aphis craccivora TaxID=307492 RepID=A0A6G0Y445_APHCR|nr:synaptic functional regulator FMR1 isoform X2 [Aphis craccivora]